MREVDRIYPNLEGRSALVIESSYLASYISNRLRTMQRMNAKTGLSWTQNERGYLMSLKEWMDHDKIDVTVLHPNDMGKSVDEIIDAHKNGRKVVVLSNPFDVKTEVDSIYRLLGERGIPIISKDLLFTEDGLNILYKEIAKKLSALFK